MAAKLRQAHCWTAVGCGCHFAPLDIRMWSGMFAAQLGIRTVTRLSRLRPQFRHLSALCVPHSTRQSSISTHRKLEAWRPRKLQTRTPATFSGSNAVRRCSSKRPKPPISISRTVLVRRIHVSALRPWRRKCHLRLGPLGSQANKTAWLRRQFEEDPPAKPQEIQMPVRKILRESWRGMASCFRMGNNAK